MGIDGNKKERLRGKEAVLVSLNHYAIIIDENQERVEQERKAGQWSTSSNTYAMAKDEASKRSDTQKDTSAQSTCRS